MSLTVECAVCRAQVAIRARERIALRSVVGLRLSSRRGQPGLARLYVAAAAAAAAAAVAAIATAASAASAATPSPLCHVTIWSRRC
jgi:hypothetical protein